MQKGTPVHQIPREQHVQPLKALQILVNSVGNPKSPALHFGLTVAQEIPKNLSFLFTHPNSLPVPPL